MGSNSDAGLELDTVADHCKRADLDVSGQLGPGFHNGGGMNGHGNLFGSSTVLGFGQPVTHSVDHAADAVPPIFELIEEYGHVRVVDRLVTLIPIQVDF